MVKYNPMKYWMSF